MSAHIVQFPISNIGNIPDGLRDLADRIDSGDLGAAHQLVWVVDAGDGDIQLGLLGRSASPGAEAHLLISSAQIRILRGVAE